MKLPQLLSQFLYQYRKLDLPGIGSFTLDAGAVIPQEADRTGHQPASGISFTNANIAVPGDDLVSYIKEHTGKMKSLAAADLDFYLTTGRQLLNIGKPFHIEGIGTLLKNNDGRLNFTPGEYLIPRVEDSGHERKAGGSHDEPQREEQRSSNVRQRQTLLLLGLAAGIIVIAWGGYTFYKRNNYVEPSAENKATVLPDTPAAKKPDTTAASRATVDTLASRLAKKDTARADATASQPAATPSTTAAYVPFIPQARDGESLFRFVILRTENKNHALRRYNQLLGYQLNIHMDQKDSSFFKLYFPIAARPLDTTRIKDSLADVYAARITIER